MKSLPIKVVNFHGPKVANATPSEQFLIIFSHLECACLIIA